MYCSHNAGHKKYRPAPAYVPAYLGGGFRYARSAKPNPPELVGLVHVHQPCNWFTSSVSANSRADDIRNPRTPRRAGEHGHENVEDVLP